MARFRQRSRIANLSVTSFAALAVATAAAPAAAQDEAAAADANVGDEIVVTAQFRAQNLQDTPLAITAVNAEMLEARSQTNIAQVANNAPSVTLKPQGAAYGPSMGASIRGVGQFDFNPAMEPGVGLYVDDVYYATLTGSLFDLLDLDRVEILRGPQGTLAGKNSIGGAVKLYSQRPEGDNSGYVSGTYGSRNRLDLRASADVGLTDSLAFRLAGVAKKQEGYVKRMDFGCVNPAGSALNPSSATQTPIPAMLPSGSDCVVARDGEVDFQAVRGQLRWQPTDRLDINLIADFTHDDRTNAGSVLLNRSFNGVVASPNFNGATRTVGAGIPAPVDIDPFTPNPVGGGVNPNNIPIDSRFLCGPYCNYASYSSPTDGAQDGAIGDGRTKYTGWGVSGQIEYDLTDDMQLVSITAYREYETIFSNDDDFTPLAHSLGFGDLNFWSFSQELRLNGSLLDDTLEYTVGGFYMDQRSVYATTQFLRYAGLPAFQGNDPVDADTKAVFAHLSYRPIDPLTLTAGIRYTDESKTYTYTRLDLEGNRNPDGTSTLPILGALDGVTGVYDGPESDRFDFRLNAQFEITTDISVYAQWSTGFKGGGINPRPFNAQQVKPFGPETLQSYELGFKSDFFDRAVRLNLAAFYSEYEGIQLNLNNCTGVFGITMGVPCALPFNAGDAEIKGVELETTIRPIDGLLIDGSASYTDFDYTDLVPNTGVALSFVSPNTPKWKWAIGAQYEIDLGASGSLTPRVDASYQSEIYTNAVNRPTNLIDSYTLANARLTWANEDGDLEISAEVTNLFDKYYLLTLFDLTTAGAGVATGQPGRPREWAVSVKKKF
jgi:iron complex outermembrane receptor protein